MIARCPLCILGDDFFGVSFFWHWGVCFSFWLRVVCVCCVRGGVWCGRAGGVRGLAWWCAWVVGCSSAAWCGVVGAGVRVVGRCWV